MIFITDTDYTGARNTSGSGNDLEVTIPKKSRIVCERPTEKHLPKQLLIGIRIQNKVFVTF